MRASHPALFLQSGLGPACPRGSEPRGSSWEQWAFIPRTGELDHCSAGSCAHVWASLLALLRAGESPEPCLTLSRLQTLSIHGPF